jgi:uncharacterized membrane-anchored protein
MKLVTSILSYLLAGLFYFLALTSIVMWANGFSGVISTLILFFAGLLCTPAFQKYLLNKTKLSMPLTLKRVAVASTSVLFIFAITIMPTSGQDNVDSDVAGVSDEINQELLDAQQKAEEEEAKRIELE